MSTIEQTLNAGVPVIFPGGEQFHLLEADEPVDVTFYESRNRPLEIWEGMKGGFRIGFEEGFVQVKILSAIGQTVKIALTGGRGEYDRSQGDVSVINIVKDNSWYYDSKDKKAFIGGAAYTASIDNPIIQIWNPAASGKLLICDTLSIYSNATVGIEYHLKQYGVFVVGTVAQQGNKYLNEAASVAIINHTELGATPGTEILRFYSNTLTERKLKLRKPIIIPEERGLLVGINEAVKQLSVVFEWTEIPA